MPVTLKDVAQRTGVSIKTVSRVINEETGVSEETRARVLRVIAESGYHPNSLARGLVQQRSRTIGLVTHGIDRYGPSRFVMGVQAKADELGYALLLALLHPLTAAKADAVLNDLCSHQVDGIIWQAPNAADTQRWIFPERLRQLPPIVINSLPNPHVTTVSIDNYHGGYTAVQHLLDHGYRRIGCVAGPLGYPMTSERVRGWHDCLITNGLDPDPGLLLHYDWTTRGGAEGIAVLLDRRPDVDAVFMQNDAMALGALPVLKQRGRTVGKDFGVVAYDDSPEAEFCDPPLSSVHQEITALGQEAVHALDRLIETKANGDPLPPPVLILSRPELVVRASSLRS